MSNCGIYYIQNKITKQLYIGQSIRLKERKQKHLFDLRNNKHQNTHLQNSFNKYGEENFEYGVTEYCEPSQLDELEIAYMELYNVKKYGFNICDGGVNICPDNSNENHGMWRNDIDNDTIKEMYLGDYNSKQIAEVYGCSRRTINRRLRKIFGVEYDVLKKQKQLENRSKHNYMNVNIRNEDILNLARNGFNSVEIASKIGCSDSTVMDRLQKIFSEKEYKEYKRKNTSKKMKKIRERITDETRNKISKAHQKYTLWDASMIHFYKKDSEYPNTCFYLRYNHKEVNIGGFKEFVSPQIIYALINEFNAQAMK